LIAAADEAGITIEAFAPAPAAGSGAERS